MPFPFDRRIYGTRAGATAAQQNQAILPQAVVVDDGGTRKKTELLKIPFIPRVDARNGQTHGARARRFMGNIYMLAFACTVIV